MLQYAQFLDMVIISFLVAAVISDVRKREVPNWVNYGLIIVGFSFNLLHSVITLDWSFVVFSVVGTVAALGLAALMFYTGQWGGGDGKLLIALGAAIGLSVTLRLPFISIGSEFVSFIFNLVAVSLPYAVGLSVLLAFRNRKRFGEEFRKQIGSHKILRRVLLAACAAGLLLSLAVHDLAVRIAVLALAIVMFSGFYLTMMARAVERSCLLKNLSPLKLTEGDWIARDVVVGGKRICGPKDLGVDKRQISQLVALYRKKKLRTVPVKEGIPFAPTFLIAFVITIFFGNLFFLVTV